MNDAYRVPNPTEAALLRKLLAARFRDELLEQLDGLLVKSIDAERRMSCCMLWMEG